MTPERLAEIRALLMAPSMTLPESTVQARRAVRDLLAEVDRLGQLAARVAELEKAAWRVVDAYSITSVYTGDGETVELPPDIGERRRALDALHAAVRVMAEPLTFGSTAGPVDTEGGDGDA